MLLARLAEDRPGARGRRADDGEARDCSSSTDLHYPGWIAEEDGRRLPILRADGWFRAVALPAGTHTVVFRYRPYSFYAGAAVSAAALLVLLVLWHRGEPIRWAAATS